MANNTFENMHFYSAINFIPTVPDTFKTHWHKYIEILFFPKDATSSRLPQIRINQTDYFLTPGDALFIWQGELHETIANGSALKGIQFPTSYISDLPEFAPFMNHFKTIHHLRAKEYPELVEKVSNSLGKIESLQYESDNFKGIEALIALYQSFISICKHIATNTETTPVEHPSTKTAKKIAQACQYIADNCDRELTLESVAEKVDFSTCYFSRVFKSATGYNFVEYITAQRVKRAQELLAESSLSITEISYQSGFKSISTFNRVFRQYKGCAPTEFRRYYVN